MPTDLRYRPLRRSEALDLLRGAEGDYQRAQQRAEQLGYTWRDPHLFEQLAGQYYPETFRVRPLGDMRKLADRDVFARRSPDEAFHALVEEGKLQPEEAPDYMQAYTMEKWRRRIQGPVGRAYWSGDDPALAAQDAAPEMPENIRKFLVRERLQELYKVQNPEIANFSARAIEREVPYLRNTQMGIAMGTMEVSTALRRVAGLGVHAVGALGIPEAQDLSRRIFAGADEEQEYKEILRQGMFVLDEESAFGTFNQLYRGSWESIIGMAPGVAVGTVNPAAGMGFFLGGAASTAGNNAYEEGRKAGLAGYDLAGYVARAATIEAGVEGLFYAAGAGGIRSMVGSNVMRKGQTGIRAALASVGKHTLEELSIETTISFLHSTNEHVTGVQPSLRYDLLGRRLLATAAQTIMTTNMIAAPRLISSPVYQRHRNKALNTMADQYAVDRNALREAWGQAEYVIAEQAGKHPAETVKARFEQALDTALQEQGQPAVFSENFSQWEQRIQSKERQVAPPEDIGPNELQDIAGSPVEVVRPETEAIDVGTRVWADDEQISGTVVSKSDNETTVRFHNLALGKSETRQYTIDRLTALRGPRIIPQELEVNLSPIAKLSDQVKEVYAGSREKALNAFTVFRNLEMQTQQTLMKFRERHADVTRVANQKAINDLAGIPLSEQRLIQLHLDNPAKHPTVPQHLQPAVAKIQEAVGQFREYHERRGYAIWPDDRINAVREHMEQLQAERAAAIKDDSVTPETIERYDADLRQMREHIERLEGYGYIHRITRPRTGERMLNGLMIKRGRKISSKPEGLTQPRYFETIEQAEAAGYKVAPLIESYSDMLQKGWRAQMAEDLVEAVKANAEIAVPSEQAPEGWVGVSPDIWPNLTGYKFNPAMANALNEIGMSADNRTGFGRAYDYLNNSLKMINFYNPGIMTWNDLQQGWSMAGLKFFAKIPEGVKIWRAGNDPQYAQRMVERGKWTEGQAQHYTSEYNAARDAGLFSRIVGMEPGHRETMRNLLSHVEYDQGQAVRQWLERKVMPNLNLPAALRRLNNRVTWNIDEILRLATFEAVQDGSLARKHGMSQYELARVAATAMADYGAIPQRTRRALNRVFAVPTYRISVGRYLGMIWRQPRKFWPQLMRRYGFRLFMQFVAPHVISMAVTDDWWNGRVERGYRQVVRMPDGREMVFTLGGPLYEEVKFSQRTLREYLNTNLAAMPRLFLGVMQGPTWRSERDRFGHLFMWGTPFWREVETLTDEDYGAAAKMMRLLGIAYVYARRGRDEDRQTVIKSLAEAMGIPANWSERKESWREVFPPPKE